MTQEVTHSQIYERLIEVEAKLDTIDKNVNDFVKDTHAISATKIRKELGIKPQ
jgi:hypothetical protein